VQPGSPAERVGFRRGDIIVSVNGRDIDKTRDLDRAAQNPSPAWRIQMRRGGQQITAVFSG
jgi:S1-C subfamily serine protease